MKRSSRRNSGALIILTLAVILSSFALFTGCERRQNKGFSVVVTVFPEYDFCRQIIGNDDCITMLLKAGTDAHSYEPTVQDRIAIEECDVFIYVGGESDAWVARILDSVSDSNRKMKTLRLIDCVSPVTEEAHNGESDDGDDDEYDEHIWTSPANAATITSQICDTLCDADADNAAKYRENAAAYIGKLRNLDNDFRDTVASSVRKTAVFGDRFPFRYLFDEYGLEYYAAFPGCSSETEASAATISYLIDKVNSERIPVIFKIEFSDGKTAATIASATGASVLELNSAHTVTDAQLQSGVTYIDIMRGNLEALRTALN